MNVASLDLCKELYELSGWQTENNYHMNFDMPVVLMASVNPDGTYYEAGVCPAYDLGYLLRKLPAYFEGYQLIVAVGVGVGTANTWQAGFYLPSKKTGRHIQIDVSPEDAACKLAIELFKQKILTREAPHQ